jgi:large repetitive protein
LDWIVPSDRRSGSAGLAVDQDKYYIVVGSTNGHSGGYVDWFDTYNPQRGTWTILTQTPRPRDHFPAVLVE